MVKVRFPSNFLIQSQMTFIQITFANLLKYDDNIREAAIRVRQKGWVDFIFARVLSCTCIVHLIHANICF